MTECLGGADVLSAQRRLRGQIVDTPVIERASFSEAVGCEVHFKCEIFQRTGSFKFRGASNAVMQLSSSARQLGVVTHSSGNHGAALALAARQAGVQARIIVPRDANPLKRTAVSAYGGTIIDCGATLAEREAALARVVEETGACFIPPYNHPHVIAGQGTVGLELRAAVTGLDEVWVPVGGGGLASGTILAMQSKRENKRESKRESDGDGDSNVSVIGVEPELADDAYWSLKRDRLQAQRPPKTIADGLRTSLGDMTFAVLRDYGLQIIRVSEQEILKAQQMLWQRLKLVVEPSGAVSLAGLLSAVRADPTRYVNKRVGVVLSGGNAQLPN